MTNTNSCSSYMGAEYCHNENESDFTNLIIGVVVVMALVFISVVLANNASVIGSMMLDGTFLGY